MYCRHCGKMIPDDSRFCSYCGGGVAMAAEAQGDPEAPRPVEGGGHLPDADDAATSEAPDLDADAEPTDGADTEPAGDADAGPADDAGAGELSERDGDPTAPEAPDGAAGDGEADSGDATDNCGSEPAGDAGETVVGDAAERPADGGPAGHGDALGPVAPQDVPPTFASAPAAYVGAKRLSVIIGAACALALLVGGAVWVGGEMARAEQERIAREEAEAEAEARRTTPRRVEVDVDATRWSRDGSGPIPVQLDGKTASGDSETFVRYIEQDRMISEVPPGDYELTVLASPIAADGVMFLVDDDPIDLSIDEDDSMEDAVDKTGDVSIELVRAWSGEVTRSDIDEAYGHLLESGMDEDDAEELRDLARERYLEDEEEEEEESSTAQTITRSPKAIDPDPSAPKLADGTYAKTYEDSNISIDIPTAWSIRVATGGGDIKDRYNVTVSGESIMYIDIMDGDASGGTDIKDAGGTQKLGMTSGGDAVIATRGNGTRAYNLQELMSLSLDTIEIF